MYLTSLPDHSNPDFNEELHFSRLKNTMLFSIQQAALVL